MKKLKVNEEWIIVKITPLSMRISRVTILIPKRVGQQVTWNNHIKGDVIDCGTIKGAAYQIIEIFNDDYNNSEQCVYDAIRMCENHYTKSIDLSSYRASYELLRIELIGWNPFGGVSLVLITSP